MARASQATHPPHPLHGPGAPGSGRRPRLHPGMHLAFAGLLAAALAGCHREGPRGPTDGSASAASTSANRAQVPASGAGAPAGTTAPITASAATARPYPAPGPADASARLAGRYVGHLPCADCPGIDETLVLAADGRFVQTDRYRERPNATAHLDGRWRTDRGGTRLRLTPANPREAGRDYLVEADGALYPLGMDGQRLDIPGDPRLHRDSPPTR